MEREYVGVLQPGEGPDLANEADLAGIRGWVDVEDLERDRAFVFQVSGKKHCCVRALSDLAANVVASAERISQRRYRIYEVRFRCLRRVTHCTSVLGMSSVQASARNIRAELVQGQPAGRVRSDLVGP